MGFNLYRCLPVETAQETYDQPTRATLSGPHGPIASYVLSVCKPAGLSSWDLSELELVALLQTQRDATETALIFESTSAQAGHITLYRLQSIHGRSSTDSTEMVFRFRSLFGNHPTPDPAQFRQQFVVSAESTAPHIYENLKLSGGLNGGTWKWMEIEQILNAAMLSPVRT
jgi:hypothetical protein